MRRVRITLSVVLTVALTSGGGCRDRGENVDIRTMDADELARSGKLVRADSEVLASMRDPAAPGRIIYDPPTDLSVANARRTRRDLFPGDTTRRDTTRTATRRDTTAGDATADTSGGSARRRRP